MTQHVGEKSPLFRRLSPTDNEGLVCVLGERLRKVLQIGDLSPKGGGPCPNGRRDAQGNPLFHKSHRGGVDFDVQIIRADRRELFRSVQISDPSTHGPTQILVTLIEEQARGHLRFIFTAGTRFLKGAHLQYEAEHTYHLHVRLFR